MARQEPPWRLSADAVLLSLRLTPRSSKDALEGVETLADGRSVLVALAAGYDVAARVTLGAGGYRAHNDLGWHSTGTCGTFGAAAGAARVMGLDQDRFASALGVAGSFAGGVSRR